MFATPLGLIALTALPAVVGLHLYRRRFRRRVVSSVFLWEVADRTSFSGRQREPLRRSPSFWLELLAALMLALALAGLRMPGSRTAEHLVAVLDGSASMGAFHSTEGLRERVLEALTERIEDLPGGSRVTVIESGAPPRQLAGPAALPVEALTKAEAYSPRHPSHDLGPALALALELSGGGTILFLTDQAPEESPLAEVEVLALGRPLDNLAIVRASRQGLPGQSSRDEVRATVANFGRTAARPTLTLRSGDEVLMEESVSIDAGQRVSVAFQVDSSEPTLALHLPTDSLTIDDVAWLAPQPPRTVGIATTFSSELAVGLGLSSGKSDSKIDRLLAATTRTVEATPESAHLVIGPTPPPGAAWGLSLESRGTERRHMIGPFLMDRGTPLLEGLTLEGIVWGASQDEGAGGLPGELSSSGSPLITAGSEPILVEQRAGSKVLFRANLDPRQSTLQQSPDWPILLSNLVEMRRRDLPGARQPNLTVGERLVYTDSRPGRYRLEGPLDRGGVQREFEADGTLIVEDIGFPGPYSLQRLDAEGEPVVARIGISLCDGRESDLRERSSGSLESASSASKLSARNSLTDIALIAVALAAMLADWLVLGRRPNRRARKAT